MEAKEPENKSRTGLVVVGMHRSGTSALSGVLAQFGANLPERLMPANAANPKGFFESLSAYSLNDNILADAGSHWSDWRCFDDDWFTSDRTTPFFDRASGLLKSEFQDADLFVLKDPRICRLIPFWDRALHSADITPCYVHIHRNPVDVAESLFARDGLQRELSWLVWLSHVLSAELSSRGKKRVFVSYDNLIKDWRGTVQRIGSQLDLNWPSNDADAEAGVKEFLSANLRHHASSVDKVLKNARISNWVRETYAILNQWANGSESEAGRTRLEAIFNEFKTSIPAFDSLIDHKPAAFPDIEHLAKSPDCPEADYDGLRNAVRKSNAKYRTEILNLHDQNGRVKTQLHETIQSLNAEKERVADLRVQLAKTEAELTNAEDRVEATEMITETMRLQIENARVEQEALRTSRDEVLSSRSWRMTSPFRRMWSWFETG